MKEKFRMMKKGFRRNWFFYLLPVPGLLCLILFSYIPMAGLYMVFERYSYAGGLFGSEFVGLYNFKFFFNNIDAALRATRNTLVINILGLVLSTAANVSFAIIMGEISRKTFKKWVQTASMLPHFVSWITIGALSISLFDERVGLFNKMLTALGADTVGWYSNPWVWWPILIITSIWKNVGYGSLVYYAALMGFDRGLYEAAAIDGATRMQRIWHITVPLLKPTIIIMVLLNIGGLLKGNLDNIMGMTRLNPLLFETTDTIATYVYRTAIQNVQFESASAVTLYQSLFGFALVMISNWLVKKVDPEYALF